MRRVTLLTLIALALLLVVVAALNWGRQGAEPRPPRSTGASGHALTEASAAAEGPTARRGAAPGG